jgi:hypothetical protein
MRAWVKQYVLQRTAEYVGGLVADGPEKEEWLRLKARALEDPDILHHEMTLSLNCHFGKKLGDPQEFFYKTFGSLLADLPEEVFKGLCDMKNLFFTYNPNPQGELKVFGLECDITKGNLHVVAFPYCSGFLSPLVLRGQIVRELAKVYTDLGEVHGQEDQIDSVAIEWGFCEEIEAAKQYEKESKNTGHSSLPRKKPLPSKTPMTSLLVVHERKEAEKRVFKLEKGATTIGRNPDNDIILKDPYVSNRHAEIRQEGDDYFLFDCASTNGTHLNGQRIHSKRLFDADIIEIGRSTLIFLSKEVSLSSTGQTHRESSLPDFTLQE